MIEYKDGDILKSGANVIAHQVNCHGVMGSGLALQIREKYPKAYDEYKSLCDNYKKDKSKLLGRVQLVTVNDETVIANIFGQLNFGNKPKLYTSYEALQEAMETLGKIGAAGYSIAIPYNIGCVRGGGEWEVVHGIIESNIPEIANCVIWKYDLG